MKLVDVIIVGSGLAALQLAKHLDSRLSILVVTKQKTAEGNSIYAQGGIAAAIGECDSPRSHANDTLEAGRHINNPKAVQQLTEQAPHLIQELIEEGCYFDRDDHGQLSLGNEGAHSYHRIVHAGGDATGQQLVRHLIQQLPPHIEFMENVFVYDLLINEQTNECYGVKAKRNDGLNLTLYASHVVLASGGFGRVYGTTSNSEGATGDGVVLAYRAGATIKDLEFIQFHPTLLTIGGKSVGLVSEAVRGAGGVLVLEDGTAVMHHVHPLGDLAPRHVVSQTLHKEQRNGRNVYLDVRGIVDFEFKFPTISSLCRKYGVDVQAGYLPVAPGCHFTMGGVRTDTTGRTDVGRLYAIGEVACTGVHGANRLASNSLLEALVYGKRLAEWINGQPSVSPFHLFSNKTIPEQLPPIPLPSLDEMRNQMSEKVGIIRDKMTLIEQLNTLKEHSPERLLTATYDSYSIQETAKSFEVIMDWLITLAALTRTESRGGHFRKDFPLEIQRWKQLEVTFNSKREDLQRYEPNTVASTATILFS
ncbi:L-aspartate oxidase [Pontibacillus halophilus JSM 076056 = DSM 19796]|uniref:L-aspartate oxidase n=1 Tax=Pontibacillus halophilus JSM 076056 = DSM 19796 TaxID=1385510 RepID=A0A0A5GRH9_9BACI|nr:L-aspartate oxidase [Pontibacillus halophilus]KGX93775.1 L-aspartate oxidase [Pontibacillus halophilus JSM 076056 = DSM 19796]